MIAIPFGKDDNIQTTQQSPLMARQGVFIYHKLKRN